MLCRWLFSRQKPSQSTDYYAFFPSSCGRLERSPLNFRSHQLLTRPVPQLLELQLERAFRPIYVSPQLLGKLQRCCGGRFTTSASSVAARTSLICQRARSLQFQHGFVTK